MALGPGSRLGHYEVLSAIGAGGMGEVYRARDTKLNRDVAIKVLPNHLLGDSDRVARFEREAQALATLNHPNIAQIYGTLETPAPGLQPGGLHGLVMEYVPGDDLSVTLRRGPLPLVDALSTARQVTLALEAAHFASIIHRDLKPANIKVTADGTVKVLDFGLARIASPDSGPGSADSRNSPTMTSPATAMGVILGTAGYMSPEQARGRFVDKRADIWAFGCVLYEMLTGRRTFDGDTVTDILAAVVTKEPDWTAVPAEIPSSIRRLLARCLQKDPRQRLHDIADARLELDTADREAVTSVVTATAPRRSPWLTGIVAIPLAAVALIAGTLIGNPWKAAPPEWSGSRLGGPIAYEPHLSPDGHLLAFAAMTNGQSQIAVMKPGTGNWNVVTHDRSHGFIDSINWGIDGQIYYDRQTDAVNGIYSVPALGEGEERLVLPNASCPVPLRDGTLLFGKINGDRVWQLHRLWRDTNKIEALPFVKNANFRLTYTNLTAQIDDERIAIIGQPAGAVQPAFGLYVLDLNSGRASALAVPLDDTSVDAVAVDPSDHSVLLAASEFSLHRLRRYRPDKPGQSTLVMDFMSTPYLSAGPDGSLYVALEDRFLEALRFPESGAPIEVLASGPGYSGPATPLDNERTLMSSRVMDRKQMLVVKPGREPLRLAQTDEPTQWPATPVSGDRAAVVVGGPGHLEIAVMSVSTGAILHRVPVTSSVSSIGASPDGKTLYFSSAGSISKAAAEDGGTPAAPVVIGPGDSLAVDPDTGDLIVKTDAIDGIILRRISKAVDTSTAVKIANQNFRFTSEPLTAGSIRKGRLVLPVGTADSWYWVPGILDLRTGRLERVPTTYATDFHFASWAPDGRIIGTGLGMSAYLWKFERAKSVR